MSKFRNIFKCTLSGVFVSLSICFMLCVYAPLELFLGNQHEFWFGLKDLMPFAWGLFALSTVLCVTAFLLLRTVNENLYSAAALIAFEILICLYAEGNFLVSNLPPLNGSTVDFSAYPVERAKFIILWLIVAVIILVLCKIFGAKKLATVAGYISLGMLGMLAITAVTLRLTTRLDESSSFDLMFTEAEKYTMSTDENLVVFSLDQASAEAFEWALAEYPEFKDYFSDYTYFDNTLGAYPFTSRALPYLLTGEWFDNSEPFQNYLNRSVAENRLMNRLWDENYSVGLYLPEIWLSADMFDGKIVNGLRETVTYKSPAIMAKMILKMTGLKYAPWDLKHFCYDIPGYNKYLRSTSSEPIYDWSSEALYAQISSDNPITLTDRKSFKIIHFEGAHDPFNLNKCLEYVENGTYKEKMASALTLTAMYIQRLKQAGVYDNTALVITADHGYGDADSYEYLRPENRRFHPVLLVKGIGETHDEMQTDHAPISYEDFQEAYMRLLDGKSSADIFDWKEGDERVRRFLFFYYNDEGNMEEWILTGDAGDVTTMEKTGVLYIYSGSID